VKWLSHDWHQGRLSDAQSEEVEREYAEHVAALRPRLSDGAAELLDLSLHDGQVQSYNRAADSFEWRILVGDLQRGYEAFPDLHFVLEDVVSDADRVAVRWTATGTQNGPFFDLAPTGRPARWTGMDMVRLDRGLLVELWANADGMALWEQLTGSPD
jgi:predicted ester cyclase